MKLLTAPKILWVGEVYEMDNGGYHFESWGINGHLSIEEEEGVDIANERKAFYRVFHQECIRLAKENHSYYPLYPVKSHNNCCATSIVYSASVSNYWLRQGERSPAISYKANEVLQCPLFC